MSSTNLMELLSTTDYSKLSFIEQEDLLKSLRKQIDDLLYEMKENTALFEKSDIEKHSHPIESQIAA